MQPVIPSVDTPCIPTSYSRVIATELDMQERSLGELLAGCGLESRALMSDRVLLTARQQIQVIRNSLRLAGDTGFGLRLGKRLTPPTHGSLGYLANSSPDLLSAINAFQEFLPTRMSFIRLDYDIDDSWLVCHLRVDFEAEVAVYRSVIEAFSLALLALVEFLIGRKLHDGQFAFRYPAPGYAELYNGYFPCAVDFSQPESVLRIPVSLLHAPNASANHTNYDLALQQCQAMLSQLPREDKTASHHVQSYMLTHPPEQVSEDEVAAALFVTKRTLARRLAQEGSSYRKIRDEIFASLASRYLQDSRLSVEAVAGLLGYHDSASFRRAFKRWYGVTPMEFREGSGGEVL